jgi:hypothetical protein
MKILEFFGTCGYVLRYLGSELMQSGSGGGGYSEDWVNEDAPRQDHGTTNSMPPSVMAPAEHNLWGTMPDYSFPESDDVNHDFSHDWSAGADYGTGAMDCGGCGSTDWT